MTKTTQQAKTSKGRLEMSETRHTKYVSPATNGVAITVFPTGQQQPSQPTIVVDVSGGPSSSCSTNPDGSRTCSISFQAPTGLDTFAISAYDQAPVNGQIPSGANLLSAGSAANQNIVAGQVNTVTVSLGGQVASIAVAPAVLLAVANQQAQSYPLSVEPLDADNYIIIPLVGQTPFNNGTLSVGVSSGDPNHTISIVPTNPSNPTAYTVNYTGGTIQDAVITASVSAGPSATANFTPVVGQPNSLTLALQVPNKTAPLQVQTALSNSTYYASIADNATQCTVSPPSQTPSTLGGSVSFTVAASNSGTCTVNVTTTNYGQTVTLGTPVTVNGTGVGLGIGAGKIKHVVVIIQENRSFDNIFGGLDNNGKPLPGVESAADPTEGALVPKDHLGNVIPLKSLPMANCYNPQHDHASQLIDIDSANPPGMDGFDVGIPAVVKCNGILPSPAPTDWVYQTLSYADVSPYWQMAEQYAIADHHFEQISSASFSEHLVLVSGTNGGMINNPARPDPGWGCDDNGNTTGGYPPPNPSDYVNFFDPSNPTSNGITGTMPCFSWPTFADLMTQHGTSWLYYAPVYAPQNPDFGYQWSSLSTFVQDRWGPAWNNVRSPSTNIVQDVQAGTLASFTWVVPELLFSDHPRSGSNAGPAYVASIVNAIGQSKFWPSTAIFLLWDDFGGMYDHVPPPMTESGPGYGLRTGLIVISPWLSKRGLVFKKFTSSAMIIKFAEETLNIPSLGGYDTDPNATDLTQMFDFTQSPNYSFTPFGANYSKQKIRQMSRKVQTVPPDDY